MNGFWASVPILLLLGFLGGCASAPPTVETVFWEQSENLSPPQTGLLLETLKILVLVEQYCRAFADGDETAYISCFSPQFSYYENTIAWFRREIRKNYFERYEKRELEIKEITLIFFKQNASFWLKQDDYDWLRGADAARVLDCTYLLNQMGDGGEVRARLGPGVPLRGPGAKGTKPRAICEVPITVTSRLDPTIQVPMAEARLKVRLRAVSGPAILEEHEEQIFLLENHGGRWRIVSLR